MFATVRKSYTPSLLLLWCILLLASPVRTQSRNAAQGAITVSGCLHAGKTVDRFTLTGPKGKAYSLRSTAVKLSDYVGHTVAIKGQLKHDAKRDDYDFEGSEVNEEYGKGKVIDPIDVEVASLKVVADSCR